VPSSRSVRQASSLLPSGGRSRPKFSERELPAHLTPRRASCETRVERTVRARGTPARIEREARSMYARNGISTSATRPPRACAAPGSSRAALRADAAGAIDACGEVDRRLRVGCVVASVAVTFTSSNESSIATGRASRGTANSGARVPRRRTRNCHAGWCSTFAAASVSRVTRTSRRSSTLLAGRGAGRRTASPRSRRRPLSRASPCRADTGERDAGRSPQRARVRHAGASATSVMAPCRPRSSRRPARSERRREVARPR